jgi:IS4 transposase
MPYLIVRTDVRANDQAGRYGRDERNTPEIRRSTATAETWDAAMRMARAFSACGTVRSGRQRVKVIRVGDD